MNRLCPILLVLALALCSFPPAYGDTVYFDDADPSMMRLGNGLYEVTLRKANGSIAQIIDKATERSVTLGSRWECLWGISYPQGTPDYVGGCSYTAQGPNRFSYTWSAATRTLTLDYAPDPAADQQVAARVLLRLSEDAWFDLHLELHNAWGHVAQAVHFPSDLVFAGADVEEALLPFLPGVVFNSTFFQQQWRYTANYPGYPGVFADYVSLYTTNGRLAVYALYGEGPIRPSTLGFVPDNEYLPGTTFYQHSFGAYVRDGASWSSPWVRVQVGQSHQETIAAYRTDNGVDRFPSLVDKLGSRYAQVVRSPLYKADSAQLNLRYADYGAFLARISVPGILHPVAYQPGGHDESYPDFLPPDASWGSIEDFAAMFRQAQVRGFLVMPYTNPTWWDDGSPTFRSLPPGVTIADVAAIACDYGPVYEHYGAHGGYVVSPYAAYVQQRLERLVRQEMTGNRPGSVPSDMLFEDQIGARPWLLDCSAAAPHPMAYIQGWLEHTRTYSDALLMTELAFDRLAETEVGFHGSLLLPQKLGYTASQWGEGTWRAYPMATMLMRDKALFYQHDLAEQTMTTNKATLAWNVAMGYMLSYDLFASYAGGGLDSEWLALVGDWQAHVLARYAGEQMTDFAALDEQATRTSFQNYAVVANWDDAQPYDVGQHTLAPGGVLVQAGSGELVAGVFTRYNGASLSPGDHYLIEERDASGITVRQLIGEDTALRLALLPGWGEGERLQALAFGRAGELLGSAPATVTAQGITFTYRRQLGGRVVAYYRVSAAGRLILPMILKSPWSSHPLSRQSRQIKGQ
jgi:hypothetical protein